MSFTKIFEFEEALAEYTGSPYVITTDCCTHALELVLRYQNIKEVEITAYTYLSVIQTLRMLGIKYTFTSDKWQGEYQIHNTNIWDSARRLEKDMYKDGMVQCISFGYSKPLQIGRGGAILTDNKEMYDILSMQRSDGRDLHISPWSAQKEIRHGYHYQMTIEQAISGLALLQKDIQPVTAGKYPDLRSVNLY